MADAPAVAAPEAASLRSAGASAAAATEPLATTPLRVIAVCSGKGGVGKTHISANLAVLAANKGLRVLIWDADLGHANVETVYGIKPRYSIEHLLHGSLSIDQILAQGPHGICVLPAGSGLQELSRLDDAQKLRIVNALDPLEDRFDLVVIDASTGIGDNVLFLASAAQETLLVATPEPTSFADEYATVKVLCQQAGVRHFSVIVNQAPSEAAACDLYGKLNQSTERLLSAQMRYLGWLPPDENVHRAAMAQRPLVDLYPASPSARALSVIATKIFDEPAPVPMDGGLKFFWQRLFRETR